MVSFRYSLNLSSQLESSYLIVVVNSVCATKGEVKGEVVVDSVEVVRPERVFVEGDIASNKYLVGIVKLSEVQRIIVSHA